MNYEEFLESVRKHFEERLGEGYKIRLNEVLKNNCIKLNGLSIQKAESHVSPNIYLNAYYEMYQRGIPADVIYRHIWNDYLEASSLEEWKGFEWNFDFSVQKEQVFIQLVNFEKNQVRLQQVPYIRFLDLAVTFHCLVHINSQGVSSIPVTIKLMEQWNVTAKVLAAYGINNSKKMFPMVVRPMEEVLSQLLEEEYTEEYQDTEELQDVLNHMEELNENSGDGNQPVMYVMTNTQGVNGAAVMLYEESFTEFAQKIGKDLYILPSSVHELIIIPYEKDIHPDDLRRMVAEVNTSQVPYEDILSDQIYLYSIQKNSFEIISKCISE